MPLQLNDEKIDEAVRRVRRVRKMRQVLIDVERDTNAFVNDLLPLEHREMKKRLTAMETIDRILVAKKK